MPGLTAQESLIDVIAHGFDIALPLGRSYATAPDAVARSCDRILSYGAPAIGFTGDGADVLRERLAAK